MKKISKITALLGILIFYHLTASGQLPGSFFSQQAEKKKLMEAQLAGYRAYLLAIKNCYRITGQGLSDLYTLKRGTAEQHAAYFHQLGQINAAIRQDPAYQTITMVSRKIAESLKTEMTWLERQRRLTPPEISCLLDFFFAVSGRCTADFTAAELLVTENALQLSDQQRLEELQRLGANAANWWRLLSHFVEKCHKLVFSRLAIQQEANAVRQLYGAW